MSKLKGNFASKQHPQVRQEVELDKPYSEFAPGDSITGRVILDAPKPIRATHLVARLHGFVKVIPHSRLPGEAIPYEEHLLNSSKGRRGAEYFGNGFAKLFEDEQVLCGDGRLYGKYSFQFELILPERNIPSSIDVSTCLTYRYCADGSFKFENGTITYLLSSTLTRPTTISPIMVEYCKLKIKENIDIASIARPRPQTVSLETVKNRRPVINMKRKTSSSTNDKDQLIANDENRDMQVVSPTATDEGPGSPVPSEGSSSVTSNGTSTTHRRSNLPTAQESRSATSALFSIASTSDKTITAQTEVLQGGCLPGDSLQVKVSVDHTKAIKSMQGVIATFYRLSRIDTHPALPLGPTDRNSKARYEDYYPKSRTGLGGLSLSSSGSSRTFRQDLGQSIAPLIVDPKTLTAVSRTSIQLPDHIFPSISGVPGAMISFKYFVEIVIDLRGKLGQDKLRPRFSMTNTAQHAYEDPRINMIDSSDGYMFLTTPGFNFLITDQVRRQKGVVFTKTELILGTKDSARSRGKQKAEALNETNPNMSLPQSYDPPSFSALVNGNHITESPLTHHFAPHRPSPQDQLPFIPPSVLPEENLDEKTQMRRAENALLPSAPPEAPESANGIEMAPSAPAALDEDDFLHRYEYSQPAPRYEAPLEGNPQSMQNSSAVENGQVGLHDSSADGNVDFLTDDKQEMERRRLQQLASSPYGPEVQGSADEESSTFQISGQVSAGAAPIINDGSTDEILNLDLPNQTVLHDRMDADSPQIRSNPDQAQALSSQEQAEQSGANISKILKPNLIGDERRPQVDGGDVPNLDQQSVQSVHQHDR